MSESKPSPSRRDFLVTLGTSAGVVALGTQGAASLRALVPNVSYDAPTTVKLGPPSDYPDGLKLRVSRRFSFFETVIRFTQSLPFLPTHLGCTVRAEALSRPESAQVGGVALKLTHRFSCPCHGSKYRRAMARMSQAPHRNRWLGTAFRSQRMMGNLS